MIEAAVEISSANEPGKYLMMLWAVVSALGHSGQQLPVTGIPGGD